MLSLLTLTRWLEKIRIINEDALKEQRFEIIAAFKIQKKINAKIVSEMTFH